MGEVIAEKCNHFVDYDICIDYVYTMYIVISITKSFFRGYSFSLFCM